MPFYNTAAPKNQFQNVLKKVSKEAEAPSDEAQKITYGVISEVNHNNGQVKVRKLLADGKIGDDIANSFLPLATPTTVVHQLFGALREGLVVRIYYRGKLNPKNVIIEVIGEEDHQLLNKEPAQNEIQVGAHEIFGASLL